MPKSKKRKMQYSEDYMITSSQPKRLDWENEEQYSKLNCTEKMHHVLTEFRTQGQIDANFLYDKSQKKEFLDCHKYEHGADEPTFNGSKMVTTGVRHDVTVSQSIQLAIFDAGIADIDKANFTKALTHSEKTFKENLERSTNAKKALTLFTPEQSLAIQRILRLQVETLAEKKFLLNTLCDTLWSGYKKNRIPEEAIFALIILGKIRNLDSECYSLLNSTMFEDKEATESQKLNAVNMTLNRLPVTQKYAKAQRFYKNCLNLPLSKTTKDMNKRIKKHKKSKKPEDP